MVFVKALGAHLRAFRKRIGYTQVDLSQLADVTQASISRLEQGHHDVHTWTLCRIAAGMKVTMAELFEGFVIPEEAKPFYLGHNELREGRILEREQ